MNTLPTIHPGTPPHLGVSVVLKLVKRTPTGYIVGLPGDGRPCDAKGRATLPLSVGAGSPAPDAGFECYRFSMSAGVYMRIREELSKSLDSPT